MRRQLAPFPRKPRTGSARRAGTQLPAQFLARTLRKKRAYTVSVIAEEIGDVYGSAVISGIEQ